ncbi:MAG TPA: mannosyltransferase family protein [Ktedonobacterales bacterium]
MNADLAPAKQRENAQGRPALSRMGCPRPTWWYAVAAWLGQRLLLLALVVLWKSLTGSLTPNRLLAIWAQYDGQWYVSIAQTGYRSIGQAAFFPLFPALMWLVAPLFGGNVALTGILLANGAALGAFIALGRLIEAELGAHVTQRALLYYAVLPTGYFLASAYTESIFLLLSVAAFLCMRQRRWLLAGLLMTLATLTRAPGALLTLPLAIEAWRTLRPSRTTICTRQRISEALSVACSVIAPFAAILGFHVYLTHVYGVADAMSRALALPQWRRSLDWPWTGLVTDLTSIGPANHAGRPPSYPATVVIDLVFLALWLGKCVAMVAPARPAFAPRLPYSWVTYSWVALLQVLILPSHVPGYGLMSLPRYVIVVFPCFTMLALFSLRFPRAHVLMFGLSLASMIFLFTVCCAGGFVA